jgi:tRNA(Arg) A34 adenosine deaminase TadA
MQMKNDMLFLTRSVEIADESIKNEGGPFGAVIVKNGEIIAEANNRVVLSGDPTAHAEILAIRRASELLKSHDLSGCILYSSCEPCPMCLGAIYWSGIKRVVYASDRVDAAEAGFDDNFIYQEIMLDPADRKVEFVRIGSSGADEVFKRWDQMTNKISY